MLVGGIWIDEKEMAMMVVVLGREWSLVFGGLKTKLEKIGRHIRRL